MQSKLLNLQNIPSHATDIRHLFRATASDIENIECQYNEETDEVVVQVPNWNKCYLEDGTLVNAIDLQVGQSVKLLEDGKEVYRTVKQVSNSDKSPGICDVVFEFQEKHVGGDSI